MLPMSNMAQLPKHRCQNYSANNKTQVHHKAARPHIHILYLSKRLLKGGLTKPSHTFRRGERSSVPVHCLHAGPAHRLRGRAARALPRRGLAGPCAPAAPLSAIRRGPGSGRPAHAGPSSPKWLPAPTKPAAPAGPAPTLPSLAEFEFTGGGGTADPTALTPAAPLLSPPEHNKRRVLPLPSRSPCPIKHPQY